MDSDGRERMEYLGNLIATRRRPALRRALVPALALVLAAAGCGSNDDSGNGTGSVPGVTEDKIIVGASSPLTGPPAAGCARVHGGAQAWFDKVNAEGGVHGRKIEWEILDDAYDLARAGANARRLADGSYFAIFGGCGSIQPPAIVPVAERAGVPYLFPMAQVPDLYLPAGKKWTYAFSPSWATMFSSVVSWGLQQKGPGSVAVLFTQNAGIESAIEAVKEATEAAGGRYLGEQVVPATTSDWTPIVLRLKELNPDYVVTNQSVELALKLMQAAEEQDFEPNISYLNTISLMADQFIQGIKNPDGSTRLDGKVISAYQVALPSDPSNAECVEAAKVTVPDMAPDGNLMGGCNSARWFVELLERAGPDLTRERLLEVISTVSNEKLSPGAVPADFSNGRHLGPSEIYIYELDGDWVPAGSAKLTDTK
jgi:ABC-type branched-subunit amino acid transport system substrate-binding protein